MTPPAATDPQLRDLLSELVGVESPSKDVEAVTDAQRTLESLARDHVGAEPTWIRTDGAPVLSWQRGDSSDPARVLLLGHIDTVWPLGTLADRPFQVEDERATGPGVFDMKGGLAVAVLALASLPPEVPATLLVTGDEEIGSPVSRHIVEEHARRAQACVVLEGAGPDGAVKSARKGWSLYRFSFHGRAAHAGLEPGRGANALLALAEVVRRLEGLGDLDRGVTVTPTLAQAGTTVNTVPHEAEVSVDVRCATPEQQSELDSELRALTGRSRHGVEVTLSGGVNRPPMTEEMATSVLDRLHRVADRLDRPRPEDVAVGGISDANLTAAVGTPTLDGLGAVGGGAHADDEWVDLRATTDRIELVAELVADLAQDPLARDPRLTDNPAPQPQERTR